MFEEFEMSCLYYKINELNAVLLKKLIEKGKQIELNKWNGFERFFFLVSFELEQKASVFHLNWNQLSSRFYLLYMLCGVLPVSFSKLTVSFSIKTKPILLNINRTHELEHKKQKERHGVCVFVCIWHIRFRLCLIQKLFRIIVFSNFSTNNINRQKGRFEQWFQRKILGIQEQTVVCEMSIDTCICLSSTWNRFKNSNNFLKFFQRPRDFWHLVLGLPTAKPPKN